jgi:NAD-dependent deacetylase sirtuin 4
MYQEFLTNPKRYRMYWARNYIGWPTFSAFQPNQTHQTFAKWEAQNKVSFSLTIINQNQPISSGILARDTKC